MAYNQQLSVLSQVAPATTGTAGQVLVSAGSSASSYWASAIPVSAYSAQFIASTTGLSVASNAAFGFGTGNFTVEFWMHITANPGTTASIMHGTASSAFIINFSSAGRIIVRSYGIIDLLTASTSVNLNAWNHIAVTRSGTTLTIWLNGVSAGTVTDSTSFATTGLYIGREDSGVSSYYYNGYISNFRIVKGVAVYTGAFTPPTSPLGTAQAAGTNIAAVTPSQVSLLTCNGPGFKDSSSNAFAITNIGNVIASQFAPFSSFSAIARSATQTQTILTSGSGTYYTPSGVAWLRIRMVGGGGGGAGGGGSGTDGSVGANTTFGSSFLVAGGGSNGIKSNGPGGAGGTSSIGSGATGASISGGSGEGGGYGVYAKGGDGGSSAFGGSGLGGRHGASINSGAAGATNSGAGGGGGNINNASNDSAGSGGGAGGYVEAYVSNPAASYAYTVGAAGAGGAGAGQGAAGGGGGSGIIIVEENYAVNASSTGVYPATYLIVAGGAGGYGNWGGGGGAGGVITGDTTFVAGTTYTMTVGAGGAAATDGVNSYINNLGVQAYGGGTGRGALGGNGSNGGSGGGAGGNQSGATTNGGSGISGQGSNGGGAIANVNPGAGGGGGAAYPGVQSTGTVAGNGGSGILNTITGSSVTYAGGGGGGNGAGQTAGTGGAGGGGNGATATGGSVVNGTAGTANLGGGGGGGSTNGGLGGAGGSGVIIISIPSANYTGITSGSPTVTTNGNYKVLTFTASGSYTA
jgi:hypothetical protein